MLCRIHWGLLHAAQNLRFVDCLCGISTRQLKLLLWRARPDSLIYSQGCTLLFTRLNNVYNEIKFKNKVLLPYVKFPCPKVAQHREFHFILFIKTTKANIDRNIVGPSGIALKRSRSNCLVLKPHRKLGNYLLSARES